ncbi:ZN430 protein, partial [Turnix velox]|nr:ZN430 protein [Turnix velox]
AFNNKLHLSRHRRLHSQDKPYKCAQCDKSYRQSNSLKLHQLLHTGEKPHRCPECDK